MPLLFLLLIFLGGCCAAKKATVYDMQVCVEHEEGDAYCNNTLSEAEVRYSPEEWDEMRNGRLSISADDYAKQRKFIEEICLKVDCSIQVKNALKNINNLFLKLEGRKVEEGFLFAEK